MVVDDDACTAVLQAPGGVGFVTYLSGSATNAPQFVSFDNLDAVSVAPPPNVAPVAAFTSPVRVDGES